jgi:DNA repair photolyase
LKTVPVPNKKRVQFQLFQAGYSTHINFSPIIYHDKKLSGYKELFNIINNEVSEEFKKQAGLECIFLTHNANLHKINLEKAFKARRNTLDTREPRTENQSWRLKPGYNRVKPALIRAFTKSVNQDLNIPIRYIF